MGKYIVAKIACFAGNIKTKGFTLIELLLVVIILGILTSFILVVINPLAQIQKSQDGQRQYSLKQLQTALDSYYNDNNTYPSSQTLTALVTAKNIQAIPTDPAASSNWPNYAYFSDSNGNSQWNIVFAKLAFPNSASSTCPLAQLKDSNGGSCFPSNYTDSGYNYCLVSGNIDAVTCDKITGSTIVPIPTPTQGSGGSPTLTPTPTNAPTLTPTPTQYPFYCYCSNATYWIDSSKDPSHQCQVVQVSSDPSVNYDRYCNSPCVNHCTQ